MRDPVMSDVEIECQNHANCGDYCETPREIEMVLCEDCLDSYDMRERERIELKTLRELRAVLKEPEAVLVNMLRGEIAIPSVRSWSKLFGEVLNEEDARLLEIAALRACAAELVDALRESERFIAGFEGCELQEGIDALLAKIRGALSAQGGRYAR